MIPHKGDLLLFWKEDNYLPLCDSCHSIVTGIFDRDKVPKPLSMKLEWMAKNRARNGVDTFSVKIVPLPKEIAAKFIAPDLERIIEKMKSQK